MKKTLLVTLDFYPTIGGISTYWEELSDHLSSDRWVVLAPPLPKKMQEKHTVYQIFRKSFFWRFVYPHWIPLFFHVWWVCKKERIEMIGVAQILPIGTVVRAVAHALGIPYYVSVHGMDIALPLTHSRKKNLCTKILKSARVIIANSQSTAHALGTYGVSEHKVHVVYPAPSITPELLSFSKKSQLLESLSLKKILLTVGRIVQRKGHAYVLRALPGILVHVPNLVYFIIGEGPFRQDLEILVDTLSIRDHVFFLGGLSSQDIAQWYNACDVFIMTPEDIGGDVEGFGIVYVEAQSFGKPVIGSKVGGVVEAVHDGETGLLIEQRNVVQIQEAVVRLMKDNVLAHQLGLSGKHRVAEEFQWKRQAEKLQYLLSL